MDRSERSRFHRNIGRLERSGSPGTKQAVKKKKEDEQPEGLQLLSPLSQIQSGIWIKT
jgi:hypothetical protein